MSLMGVALLMGLASCGNRNQAVKQLSQDASQVQDIGTNLTLNDITLEQADEQGQPVWKVKAKQATYSKNQKVAQVQSPTGELFQDGKPVYQISAQQGEIQQDGKQLFLKGKIVATDPRNGVVLRGNELEWRPKEDLLIVRNQLTGTHRQVQAVAQEARVFSRKAVVELQGKVIANAITTQKPKSQVADLQMRTEHLIWQVRAEKLIGDRPIAIDRYKAQQVTERATANSSDVNLKTKIATLKQNAQVLLLKPPLQVSGNNLSWNLDAETIDTNQPVQIVHRQEQVKVTANQGRMDLQKEIAYLTGNVYGVGKRRQSLKANALTWYFPNQLVEANGDVTYQQVEPPASFSGQKAVGKLEEQNIVVSGGRVITKIVP